MGFLPHGSGCPPSLPGLAPGSPLPRQQQSGRSGCQTCRAGFFLPLVILAAVGIAFLFVTMTTLSQGTRSTMQHANQRQTCFQIAFAGCSRMLAKLQEIPWSQRVCLNAPYRERGQRFGGGTYEAWVENVSGKPDQVDISILAQFAGLKALYFWRIRRIDSVLNLSGQFRLVLFTSPDVENFPAGGGNRLQEQVEALLAERESNRPHSEETAAILAGETDVGRVVSILGGRAPVNPPPPVGGVNPPRLPVLANFPTMLPPGPSPAGEILGELPIVGVPFAGVPGDPRASPEPGTPPEGTTSAGEGEAVTNRHRYSYAHGAPDGCPRNGWFFETDDLGKTSTCQDCGKSLRFYMAYCYHLDANDDYVGHCDKRYSVYEQVPDRCPNLP
jgi:hypothetical protein